MTEQSGIARTGSPSLIDNMGAMLAIAVVITLVLVLLLVLWLCAKKVPCIRKLYLALKNKLFYNTFLRYILQSTLKLQLAATTVIASGKLTATNVDTEG